MGLDYSTESMGIDQDPHTQLPANPCALPGGGSGRSKKGGGASSSSVKGHKLVLFASFGDPVVWVSEGLHHKEAFNVGWYCKAVVPRRHCGNIADRSD